MKTTKPKAVDESQKYENDCNCEQYNDEYAGNSEEYWQNDQCDYQQTQESDDEENQAEHENDDYYCHCHFEQE